MYGSWLVIKMEVVLWKVISQAQRIFQQPRRWNIDIWMLQGGE
jgi:hypothetical protein